MLHYLESIRIECTLALCEAVRRFKVDVPERKLFRMRLLWGQVSLCIAILLLFLHLDTTTSQVGTQLTECLPGLFHA